MKRVLFAVLGLAIVALSALSNAFTSDRWQITGEPETSAKKLSGVASRLTGWEGTDSPAHPGHLAIAGAEGHLIRVYKHRFAKKEVTVMLLCGKARPISFHPPEACYAGAGYAIEGERADVKIAVGGDVPAAEFFRAVFKKEHADGVDRLQIYWAWAEGGKKADGKWHAAPRARQEFRRAQALYKLYVIRAVSDGETPADKDACAEFLEAFLPELHDKLFPKQAGPSALRLRSPSNNWW